MNIHFYKYHGTGNDFVIIDNREKSITLTQEQVNFLCDRHFGIGADGLMLLELEDGVDFKMVYYNSDGNESTMCGNGGRCITAFAKKVGVISENATFIAIDGLHSATISEDGIVALGMQDVNEVKVLDDHTILNTGSPHYVKWTQEVDSYDVVKNGRSIRNEEQFQPKGINVNFVQLLSEGAIKVRTYERGVENETLSCGTGVTASAIASVKNKTGSFNISINTPGGKLAVSFDRKGSQDITNVTLHGPTQLVYEGDIEI